MKRLPYYPELGMRSASLLKTEDTATEPQCTVITSDTGSTDIRVQWNTGKPTKSKLVICCILIFSHKQSK